METKYLEIARKLKALADQGIAGEKYNAQKQLDRIMKKYGITSEQLEEDKRILIEFKIRKSEQKLFLRIGMMVTGVKRYWGRHKSKTSCLFSEVTKAEEAEIRSMWNFYSRVWQEQLESFYLAFFHKHALFPADSTLIDVKNMTDEERKKVWLAQQIMEGIEKAHYKRQLR